MEKLLNELVFELNANNISVGTAEQCSCGLVGASIASIANRCVGGSMYKGSITIQNEDNLIKVLDVSPNAFKNYGMVSSQVACQMALGGLYKMETDVCVAVVGNIKSGVVWLCTARKFNKTINFRYKQLLVEGTNSEKINKVLEEAIEITLLHVLEKVPNE